MYSVGLGSFRLVSFSVGSYQVPKTRLWSGTIIRRVPDDGYS